MAPRTLISTLFSPRTPSSVCLQCRKKLQRRNLATSTPLAGRAARAEMFKWLRGPGSVFKTPLEGSTNYLNAYDKEGDLIRMKIKERNDKKERDSAEARAAQSDENGEDEEGEVEEQGVEEKKEEHEEREEEEAEEEEYEENEDRNNDDRPKSKVPTVRERASDLMPFPLNSHFQSQAVLSEELKDEIYKRVVEQGQEVRKVSTDLLVEMRRIGAVVRLKALEKEWLDTGKPLATAYAKAVTAMLPQTPYVPGSRVSHESINDLPVHSATTLQVFHPTSESRHFTRTDAGRVFDPHLLPAEARIPHPQLVESYKLASQGLRPEQVGHIMAAKAATQASMAEARDEKRRQRVEKATTKKETERWEFRFTDVNIEQVGKDERARNGLGARYGVPSSDRKKGQIKIPRRVE